MAPEQAFLDQGELTPAADVYALGAILYELFTGRPPHEGQTFAELMRRIALEEPVPPRELAPGLSRDLETVCLQALKRLNARYRSAADFADDLQNALQHRPITARRSSFVDRWVRWVWRHPLSTVATALALALFAMLAWALVRAEYTQIEQARRAQQAQLEQALSANAFTATGQAGAALYQLKEYAEAVTVAARDPAVVRLVDNDGRVNPAPRELAAHLESFDTLFVLDVEGRPRAHVPERPPDYFERLFAFRDYFRQAGEIAQHCPSEAYLARAFRSEADGKIKFALAAPLLRDGVWVGAYVGTIQADSAFGEVQLQDPEGDRSTALLGPRDVDRHEETLPSALTLLVHDGLVDKVEHMLAEPLFTSVAEAFGEPRDPCGQFKLRKAAPLTIADYRDPVPGFEGRWLAGIAPVGHTGFVIVVQTRPPASSSRADGDLP
jgi:serine/threonine-protein kinase